MRTVRPVLTTSVMELLSFRRMLLSGTGRSFEKGSCRGYRMGQILRRADGGSESARLRSQTRAKATGGGSSSPSAFGVAETISLARAFAVGTGESPSPSGDVNESVAGD